jgi:hypothetical protein
MLNINRALENDRLLRALMGVYNLYSEPILKSSILAVLVQKSNERMRF